MILGELNLCSAIFIVLIAYFIGNVQVGLLIARRLGVQDIRQYGSGGTGATNVLRNLGLKASLLTFGLDILKGVVAGMVGRLLFGFHTVNAVYGAMLGGIFAAIGHIWPALFAFRGGKGVSTSLGALICVDPVVGLIGLVVALIAAYKIRIISIVSMTVALVLCIALALVHWGNVYYILFGACLVLMILYSHRDNIKRLKDGKEKKLNF